MAGNLIVVIGAGLAGCAAAAAARRAGAQVLIIDPGPGATAFSSGALDLAGDPGATPGRPDLTERNLAANLNSIIARHPDHPYAALGRGDKDPAGKVMEILREARALVFPDDGLVRLEGGLECNRPAFTSLGTVKFTAFTPEAAARPDADGMARPLVMGIAGLIDFDPLAWSKVAQDNAARLGFTIEPRAAMAGFGAGANLQTPALANLIARDPDDLVAAVKQAAAGNDAATCVVLPAALPAPGRADLLRRLAEATARPVYETLSMPPSVPGLRLREHLAALLEKMGVERTPGRVTGFVVDNGKIKSLRVAGRSGETAVEVRAVVLATGKFLAGGLAKDRGLRETVFDLPVFLEGVEAGDIYIGKAVSLSVTGPHPLFAAGVMVTDRLQPRGRDGSPAHANLLAAGSILAGFNYLTDGAAAGVALATGLRAGQIASE